MTHTEQRTTDFLNLLATPADIERIAREEELLDALQDMYLLSLLDYNRDTIKKRREIRALLMRRRPVTFQGFLDDNLNNNKCPGSACDGCTDCEGNQEVDFYRDTALNEVSHA